MPEPASRIPTKEECAEQVERILRSKSFRGSDTLRNILSFFSRHSLESPGSPVKEYVLATEVLGRPPDFDPRLDAAVRVQTGRLRSRLAEYYIGEGSSDPVFVNIPKGSHALVFAYRTPSKPAIPSAPGEQRSARPGAESKNWRVWAPVLLLIAAASSAITWLATRPASMRADATLVEFWGPFLAFSDAPLVAYSNAAFVGSPRDGLRYFRSSTDSPNDIKDSYTGVGEVMAIRDLTNLFGLFRHPLRVKRSRLVSWDDARTSNLIFVGSPGENVALREIPGTQDFRFKSADLEPHVGRRGIINTKPRAGEPAVYLTKPGLPFTDDYGVVALTPALSPGRWVLILAGTSTFGTQAAAEFVCRPDSVKELLAGIARGSDGTMRPFEALLHVKLSGGVPTSVRLVSVHLREGK